MRRTELTSVVIALLICGCAEDEKMSGPDASVGEVVVAPKAQLKQSAGEVSVKRAAGDDWVAAAGATELFENDKVRTAKGANATIRFANGSEVTLGEDALIAIAETRTRPGNDRTDLTVFKGRINAELDTPGSQSLTVSTPSATVRAGREIVFQ